MLYLITAMAQNGAIGKNNQIPWHLPADFQHNKQTVMGKTILFGANTYESVIGYYQLSGRPVPYKEIIVLTDDPNFKPTPGIMHISNPEDLDSAIHSEIADKIIAKPLPITIAHSVDDVLALAQDKDIYVSGGLGAYKAFLPLVDKLYITRIEADIDGDTYFPEVDFSKFKEIAHTFRPKDEKNIYDINFITYERKTS